MSPESDAEPTKASTKKQPSDNKQVQESKENEQSENQVERDCDENIDPKLKKIIKNSTADMWNLLRKTWIEYVNTVNDYNSKKTPDELQEQSEIAIRKGYLENNIEKYLTDLGLEHNIFKNGAFLTKDVNSK